MLTVYFDTSFFINVLRESDEVVASVVHRLQLLDVRHVVSPLIVRELLGHPDSVEQSTRLVCWLAMITSKPFCIEGATLDTLLVSSEDRQQVASYLQGLDDQLSEANAMAMAARTRDSLTLAELENAHPAAMHKLGLRDGQAPDLSALLDTMGPLLLSLGLDLDLAAKPPAVIADEIMAAVRAKYGDLAVDHELTTRAASHSAIRGEPRTKEVALGRASRATKKGFLGAMRDGEHMAFFARHRADIDLFQMDGRQLRKLQQSPDHLIRMQGLESRCFSARNIVEAVQAIETFASRSAT